MSARIVSIGEVLWDLLPSGPVLGGAPANFAVHAQALGAEVGMISRVGNDQCGHEIITRLRERGLETELIGVDEKLPTGTVSVTLGADGQPQYVIHSGVAWDAIDLTNAQRLVVGSADAVCFGSLAQRSELSGQTVRTLVGASRGDALRIFDINLRQSFYTREVLESSLELANVLKLNETELPVLAGLFGLSGSIDRQLNELAERFELRALAYTRGAQGSFLMNQGEWSDHGGVATTVRDAVGAGDAFTAAFVRGLLIRSPLKQIHQQASEIAAYVCSQSGSTPKLPPALTAST